MKRKNICVLPGDGVGIEVTEAVVPLFEALELPVTLNFGQIGWECWRAEGNTVPQATWRLIQESDATLLGAITSKPQREAQAELPNHLRHSEVPYVSPVIQLRQRLSLYANVRPVTDVIGDERFRFTVIRENTEGLYAGLDYASVPLEIEPLLLAKERQGASWQRIDRHDAAVSLRLQTRLGVTRLLRFACDHARAQGFDKVTLADKPNVLRNSSAFVRDILEEVAADYPDLQLNIENVDAVALWMVQRPERFGVIVAENMFGDILSDLGAGVMGGLGLAPSANIGEHGAYFEPVHGSAPAHAGLNKANPSAMFLSVALLLEYLDFTEAASRVRSAVRQVAQSDVRTYDLGGSHSTTEVAQRIIDTCLTLNQRGTVRPSQLTIPEYN
ncbi:isocitrate/isopropylmalate family dehydrogenase [Pseudomonas sp. M5]|uniref:isocitrate/isopropylmalate dehydrogenase family protein n=1 Tax=Pseudomonas sp. M5 TaxID=1620788 RepID=UPI001958A7EE|nr:isocitrate/isopropylmalate family dehydrogenase [Pseudomonas sp. M5]MBM7396537.1 3-isopropylmalate dehydrogenase [Pseudomonas sp. M5]HDS1754477.1 isocitrate/isopropylmalate dehydrogenase family protein [Pseudomonas putida]